MLAQHLRGSVSFVNFKNGTPERTLDLGCGVRVVITGSGQLLIPRYVDWNLDHRRCKGMARLRIRTYCVIFSYVSSQYAQGRF